MELEWAQAMYVRSISIQLLAPFRILSTSHDLSISYQAQPDH